LPNSIVVRRYWVGRIWRVSCLHTLLGGCTRIAEASPAPAGAERLMLKGSYSLVIDRVNGRARLETSK
jgi:hypothetical protein